MKKQDQEKKPRENAAKSAQPAEKRKTKTAAKAADSPPPEVYQIEFEKLTILRRLIYLLKRVIGYRKGRRDEFRYNIDTDHPNYIFEDSDGKKRGVGITHEAETFGKKNMPLSQNPDKTDSEPAFVRTGIVSGKRYGKKPIKKMKFAPRDKANVKSKIRNYKKRRKRAKKNNKKSK